MYFSFWQNYSSSFQKKVCYISLYFSFLLFEHILFKFPQLHIKGATDQFSSKFSSQVDWEQSTMLSTFWSSCSQLVVTTGSCFPWLLEWTNLNYQRMSKILQAHCHSCHWSDQFWKIIELYTVCPSLLSCLFNSMYLLN